MRDNLTQLLMRYRRGFSEFSNGQKAVAIVGGGALLLAAFLVFRWVSAPTYAPLYSNLAGSDASAVVDDLNKEGIKYKLAANGSTVEVPQNEVYSTRISLSGKNLPAGNSASDGGYTLLDNQSMADSDFQEQTTFKRAMEGELANTLEAMTGVQTAVVHLAIPEKQVFSDTQDPTTAAVLLGLEPGTTLSHQQVQAVVHLVASSIDGLDPDKVTVSDQNGNVLSAPDDSAAGMADDQAQQTSDYEAAMQAKVQAVLDKIVGPGNATANVTANLNFDQKTTDNLTYGKTAKVPALSAHTTTETYKGPASGASTVDGVVGPDGQMESTTGTTGSGNSTYDKSDTTSDNGVDTTREHIETTPGQVESLHIGAVIDTAAIGAISPSQVKQLIASSVGINTARGDTIDVTQMPFNKTAAAAAAKELAAAQAAAKHVQTMKLLRDAGIAAVIAIMLLLAWIRGRRRAKAREQATSYVVEQLRADAAARAVELQVESPALAALEAADDEQNQTLRNELNHLVDKQPEDVAALLRGWLVEKR